MIKPDHPHHYISPPDIPIHQLPKAKQKASTNDIQSNLLNLLVINFQSIISKRAAFLNLIDDHRPDIIFGTETWLSPTISTAEFLPANYMSFRKDRNDGYGGFLLAFRDTLNVTEYLIDNPNQCEIIACTLKHEKQEIIICSIYRPPSTDTSYLQELMSILEKIAITNPTTPIWIGGDLNLSNIDWSMGTVFNNCYPLALCNIVLDFIADHGFSQLVHTPTRNNNILDIFFTNQSSLTKLCEVIPGISDHEIVSISTSITIPYSRPIARNILLWHRADLELINHHIAQFTAFFMNTYDSNTPIDTLWNKFKTLCNQCLNMIPQKCVTTKVCPSWLTGKIKRLSRRKQRKYNKACLTNNPDDRAAYHKLKKGYVVPPVIIMFHHC